MTGHLPVQPIAVDAMGGDRAPEELVKGAAVFLGDYSDAPVLLVGDEGRLKPLIAAYGLAGHAEVSLKHAPETIAMHEKLAAVRRKPGSSLMLAIEAVRDGEAGALVALGNTLAVVALTHLKWGLLAGVERAGIAVPLPNRRGVTVVIDMGANVSARPEHLRDYAVMASIYTEKVLGRRSPRVGLLNVGEESGKGSQLLRDAYALIEKSPVNFGGNAEGRDIFMGDFDVVVCDGFAGNVVLKAAEGAAELLLEKTKGALLASPLRRLGAWLCRGGFRDIRRLADYGTYGGAPLLGVNGICIIGHGRSSALAVANALRVAREAVLAELPRRMSARIAGLGGNQRPAEGRDAG